MRHIALATLIVLAACSPKLEEEVAAEPVVVEEEPAAVGGLYEKDCTPGDDDGIGGTGCEVD
jgi:hypothetical protein